MIAGIIKMFAGSTAPTGYLLCDGSAVSRSTYADLFAAIGTIYGTGDGSTTFNLPDLSGRVAMGTSSTYTLGSTGGEESHVLLDTEIPEHVHEVPTHGHENDIMAVMPALSHTITQPAFNYSRPNGTAQAGASSGVAAISGTTSTNASRATNVAVAAHAATACTTSGGITDCAAFDTDSVGLGSSHNNMQPFVTMNYVISIGG
jgi:microcystin-dependent protein